MGQPAWPTATKSITNANLAFWQCKVHLQKLQRAQQRRKHALSQSALTGNRSVVAALQAGPFAHSRYHLVRCSAGYRRLLFIRCSRQRADDDLVFLQIAIALLELPCVCTMNVTDSQLTYTPGPKQAWISQHWPVQSVSNLGGRATTMGRTQSDNRATMASLSQVLPATKMHPNRGTASYLFVDGTSTRVSNSSSVGVGANLGLTVPDRNLLGRVGDDEWRGADGWWRRAVRTQSKKHTSLTVKWFFWPDTEPNSRSKYGSWKKACKHGASIGHFITGTKWTASCSHSIASCLRKQSRVTTSTTSTGSSTCAAASPRPTTTTTTAVDMATATATGASPSAPTTLTPTTLTPTSTAVAPANVALSVAQPSVTSANVGETSTRSSCAQHSRSGALHRRMLVICVSHLQVHSWIFHVHFEHSHRPNATADFSAMACGCLGSHAIRQS